MLGGLRLLVSGPELVDEICDDTRFDKKIGGGLRSAAARSGRGGAVHRRDRRPAVGAGAQRAHDAVQPAGDARLHAQDARRRRPADGQVGAAQPRRGGRRRRGHDPAHARHDRAVRLRLPVQLLLPRVPAPVRRRDGAGAHRGAGPGPAAADPDPAPGAGAAAVRGGRGVHERPRRPDHRGAPRRGRRGRHHGPARPDDHRRRQGRRTPARREHPGAVHHVPHRGPRDDLGPAVVRDLLPDEAPGRAGPRPRRGRRGVRRHRRADVRAGAPPALRPADPRRDPAAVADRAGLQPHALRGHRDRRQVRGRRGHPDRP